MGRKWIGRLFLASGLALLISGAFIAIYYNLINKEHTGPMDWWAVVLLVIPTFFFCFFRIIIDIKKISFEESFSKSSFVRKLGDIILKVFTILGMIFLFPIILLFIIFELIFGFNVSKKSFKKLIKKGFKYKNKNKAYILTRENIVIEILYSLEDYYISFDNGENFVRIEESDLGLPYNRDELKRRLNEYKNAHPVDKQRGDALPPLSYFIDFLDNFIE